MTCLLLNLMVVDGLATGTLQQLAMHPSLDGPGVELH